MGPMDTGKNQLRRNPEPSLPPDEFVCPISGHLMLDPVNVASGHTFERTSVQICKDLSFAPLLPDGSTPDFSGSLVPNRNIRSMIQRWCDENGVDHPRVDYYSIEDAVRSLMAESNEHKRRDSYGEAMAELLNDVPNHPPVRLSHALTTPHVRSDSGQFSSGSQQQLSTPLPFKTMPASYSSSPADQQNPRYSEQVDVDEDDENNRLLMQLTSSEAAQQEEGIVTLRSLTRTDERTRSALCTQKMLSIFRPLILSRNATIQVNAVASLVNLSLEKRNKGRIVGSGLVPPLIEVLHAGFPESQEHAAGALFSLSLEEDNQTAIGVLGGLDPLLHSLRSDSDRTRHDSALALYHLSLNQSNRVKLVRLGAVPILLNLLTSRIMAGRAILVLCNLALCAEGKSAMLDGNAVVTLTAMLREDEFDSEATLENVVATLCALGQGSLRFNGMAREAGAAEVLSRVVERTKSERARERARQVLQMMRGRGEEEEEEGGGGFGRRMFEGGTMSQTPLRQGYGGGGRDLFKVNTTRF
uniref:RING-type E3 ubiquitin transferase n=1 Tax=Kalanchoe fedtschenkoi TaxID=63787 RepID=A0A7N1A6W5_KALFE